jgi:hypothetical protein
MGTPNTTLLPSPTVEFSFYNEYGSQVDESYEPSFTEVASEPTELYDVYQRVIRELSIDKPKWMIGSEVIARKFLRCTLGIASTTPIFMLQEDGMLDEIGLREPPSTIAMVEPFLGSIIVRGQKLRQVYDDAGLYGVAGVLAHEGFHSEASLRTLALQKEKEGEVQVRGRWGLGTEGPKGQLGVFAEEGSAVMFQALCMSKSKSLRPTLPSSVQPTIELPEVYQRIHNLGGVERAAGPDGYAMELLAWSAEQRKIMKAADFMRMIVASRKHEAAIEPLRQLPKVINAIQPGLYARLLHLPYGKEGSQAGLEIVHEAVRG